MGRAAYDSHVNERPLLYHINRKRESWSFGTMRALNMA